MIVPNIWENKKCSKPPNSKWVLLGVLYTCEHVQHDHSLAAIHLMSDMSHAALGFFSRSTSENSRRKVGRNGVILKFWAPKCNCLSFFCLKIAQWNWETISFLLISCILRHTLCRRLPQPNLDCLNLPKSSIIKRWFSNNVWWFGRLLRIKNTNLPYNGWYTNIAM